MLAAATVVLVGVPVIAGFWSTDANQRVIEAPIIRVPAINCLAKSDSVFFPFGM